jgi:DNA (cytosine-5)-methyltransferase 1
MKPTTFRFIDLFAGLGGFHVALERLGGECVFAAEWKEHLRELYKENHGLYPAGDITQVDPSAIPDHDVLTAGFPCQPFSKAGEQLGFECTKQGNLFFNVELILMEKRPSFFILENVPNLLKHDNGRTWAEIQQRLGLDGLGYHIKSGKFSPHNFGIPQIRERVYIVGSLKSLDEFKWPEKDGLSTNIDTVLDENPVGAKQLSVQVQECLEVWNEFLKATPTSVILPSHPLWSMEWGATYPYEEETPYGRYIKEGEAGLVNFRGSHGKQLGFLRNIDARFEALPSHARTKIIKFPKWKKDYIRKNREFYEKNEAWIKPWLPRILKFPSSLQKLEWNVQGGVHDIWQYVLQFRASGVRIKRRTTAPSLIAMTDTQVPIIAWERRYMTPLECARLQSLENLKKLPSSASQAFQALGNAVNSKVVQKVANALLTGTYINKNSSQKID